MLDVIGVGQCSLDYLGFIDSYPEEDAKKEFTDLLIQGGGPVATALAALTRLGRTTSFVGRVGDDRPGRVIRDGLKDEGVTTDHLQYQAGRTSQLAFIMANPHTATRTIFWTRSTAGEVDPEHLPLNLIRSARVLHLDGLYRQASLVAARAAGEAGVKVVLDAGTLRPHSLELAALADHLVVAEPFINAIAPDAPPEEAVRRLYDLGGEAAVVTLGKRGSWGFDGVSAVHCPAFEVVSVDTTGAGDAFHAGYIHGLLSGADLIQRMRLGSAVAALSTTALGGRTALPDLQVLESFLAARG